jgi:hypothetical protein
MLLAPLLAAAAIAPAASDFDGLTVSGLAPAGEPRVQGAVRTWDIPNEAEVDGKKVMMGNATVTVTDVSVLPEKISADQVMGLHYAGMQRLPGCFAINLSKFKAKLGDHPVALTLGSLIAPSAGGGYTPAYVCSLATLIGTKVYEVAQFRTSGPYTEMDFKYLKETSFKNGDSKLTMSDFPEIWSQPFQLGGVPFQLDWDDIPNPLVLAAAPEYAGSYSAWSFFESWNVDFELRQLKPAAKFEPEAFIKSAFVNRVKATSFTVTDVAKVENEDRWTAKIAYEIEGGRPQRGKVELLKKGDWVAGQMLRGQTTLPPAMEEKFKIALVK